MKELQSGTAKLKEDYDPFFDDPASPFNRQLSELKCRDTLPTLEDLERKHPAGIFVKDHNIFYMLNDACELGGYYLFNSDWEEMFFEREPNYVDFLTIGLDEVEELKKIAHQIKNNLDKIFKEFYSRTWH